MIKQSRAERQQTPFFLVTELFSHASEGYAELSQRCYTATAVTLHRPTHKKTRFNKSLSTLRYETSLGHLILSAQHAITALWLLSTGCECGRCQSKRSVNVSMREAASGFYVHQPHQGIPQRCGTPMFVRGYTRLRVSARLQMHCSQAATQSRKPWISASPFRCFPMNTMRLFRGEPSSQGFPGSPEKSACTPCASPTPLSQSPSAPHS